MFFYKIDENNKARYLLGETPENSSKVFVCIGLNPSATTPDNIDKLGVKKRSIEFGYHSWLMINLYPQRVTNPNQLNLQFNENYHQKNLKYISEYLQNKKYDIWAAWGNSIEKRIYLPKCLKDLILLLKPLNWYTIGPLTKKQHPHHPLYLKNNLPLIKFEPLTYLKYF